MDDVGRLHPDKSSSAGRVRWSLPELCISQDFLWSIRGRPSNVYAELLHHILLSSERRQHFHPRHVIDTARLRDVGRAIDRSIRSGLLSPINEDNGDIDEPNSTDESAGCGAREDGNDAEGARGTNESDERGAAADDAENTASGLPDDEDIKY